MLTDSDFPALLVGIASAVVIKPVNIKIQHFYGSLYLFLSYGSVLLFFYYENMSVQYEAIFKSGKNDIIRCKNVTFFFLIFAQNIDCGYTLEPPH